MDKSRVRKISKDQVRKLTYTTFQLPNTILEMLEGRLREGFVRIEELMASEIPILRILSLTQP